jgi:hypothetical protein
LTFKGIHGVIDRTLHNHRGENLKSYIFFPVYLLQIFLLHLTTVPIALAICSSVLGWFNNKFENMQKEAIAAFSICME